MLSFSLPKPPALGFPAPSPIDGFMDTCISHRHAWVYAALETLGTTMRKNRLFVFLGLA